MGMVMVDVGPGRVEDVRVRLKDQHFSYLRYMNQPIPNSFGFAKNPLLVSDNLKALKSVLMRETEVSGRVTENITFASDGNEYYFPRSDIAAIPGMSDLIINDFLSVGLMRGMGSVPVGNLRSPETFIGVTDLGKALYSMLAYNESGAIFEPQTLILPIVVKI